MIDDFSCHARRILRTVNRKSEIVDIRPLCLSSYRSGFVNRYSSVRVRPEAPFHGDHDVTAASRPVTAFVPVQFRLVTPILQFEPVRSESDSPLDLSCISWFNRGSNPHADYKSAPWIGDGRNPATVRDSKTGVQAQPEVGPVKIARAVFPPSEGGLLSRTINF